MSTMQRVYSIHRQVYQTKSNHNNKQKLLHQHHQPPWGTFCRVIAGSWEHSCPGLSRQRPWIQLPHDRAPCRHLASSQHRDVNDFVGLC